MLLLLTLPELLLEGDHWNFSIDEDFNSCDIVTEDRHRCRPWRSAGAHRHARESA